MDTPTVSHTPVIVVGAGVAGLQAARTAQAAGHGVLVLEKSRGFGGRAATRTVDGVRIDHGAQFATARTHAFREVVDAWQASGDLTVWSEGFARHDGGSVRPRARAGHPRFIFPRGMNSIGKLLAEGVNVVREALVQRVEWTGDAWQVTWSTPDPSTGEGAVRTHRATADAVVVTAPFPQATAWIDVRQAPTATDAPSAETLLDHLRYRPCFAWMAAFDVPAPAWHGVTVDDHPVLAWVAHDGSKRAPPPSVTTVVAHSTPSFAEHRFDDDRTAVAHAIEAAVADVTGWSRPPIWSQVHRWRYALVDTPWPSPFVELRRRLFLAGDGFALAEDGGLPPPGRVESAWTSGRAVGHAVGSAVTAHASHR